MPSKRRVRRELKRQRKESWPRATQRKIQWEFFQKKKWELLRVVGLISTLIPLTYFLLPRGLWLFTTGAVTASAVAITWNLLALGSGSINTRFGVWGEDATVEELHKLPSGTWRFIRGLRLHLGDIDVIAIGPPGVVAIEVKWINDPRLTRDATMNSQAYSKQARRNAIQVRSILKRIGHDRYVNAVVVMWGPGSKEFVARAASTDVLYGGQLRDWLLKRNALMKPAEVAEVASHLSRLASVRKG